MRSGLALLQACSSIAGPAIGNGLLSPRGLGNDQIQVVHGLHVVFAARLTSTWQEGPQRLALSAWRHSCRRHVGCSSTGTLWRLDESGALGLSIRAVVIFFVLYLRLFNFVRTELSNNPGTKRKNGSEA